MAILDNVESHLDLLIGPLTKRLASLSLEDVFGRRLAKLLASTAPDVGVELLLRADVLRVTLICLYADGKLSEDEAREVLPLVQRLAGQLSKLRPDVYGHFRDVAAGDVDTFFRTYWQDSGPFGFTCGDTKWRGLLLCRAVDLQDSDNRFAYRFAGCLESLALRLVNVDGLDARSKPAFDRLTTDLKRYQAEPDTPTESADDVPVESVVDAEAADPRTVEETTTWTVVIGRKRREGVSRLSLQQAAEAEELNRTAFLKPDDQTADWTQAAVCDWLYDTPDVPRTRYCGECLTRIVGDEQTLKKRPPCPSCGRHSDYIDFLQTESPPIRDVPVEPWGRFDLMIVAASAVGLLAVLVCAISLLFVSSILPVLITFFLALAATVLMTLTYQHRSQSGKYRSHLQKVEQALADRTSALHSTEREYRLLQNNLQRVRDDLIAETTARCLQVEGETEEARAVAEYHAKTVERVAEKYLDEQRKWWTQKLRGDNYQLQKSRIEKAIAFVEREAYVIPNDVKQEIFDKLQHDYKLRVRKEAEMERQRAAKAKLRAEQKAIKEAEEARLRAEAEQRAIEEALAEALSRAGAEHSAEVDLLRQQLLDAEERGRRAISQAQLTKTGYVYVISNIGCFGDDVYKIGLTRRLEPLDRVKELSGASVAFPFDVHMLIYSDDAPTLEHTLHKSLHRYRVNRVNFRKEFFRIDIDTIREVVERQHGTVEFEADAEALEYRSSLEISDEDFAFLENIADEQGIDFESDED